MRPEPGRTPVRRFGLSWAMAVAVLLALVAGWLWDSPSPVIDARRTAERPAATSALVDSSTAILTLALSPTHGRAGPIPEARIARGTQEVLLELQAHAGESSARRGGPLEVVVRRAGGEPIWKGGATAPSESSNPDLIATVRLPPKRLPPGDYIVTLSTVESRRGGEPYEYSFRVAP